VSLAFDLARGMLYLHTRPQPVIHRDLKSPNVLVDGYWNAKVADLNLSRAIDGVHRTGSVAAMSTAPRTINGRWLAPELLRLDSRSSPASDVYAVGVIMWELLTWQVPFGANSDTAIVACLLMGQTLDIPAPKDLPGPEPASAFRQLDHYIALMKKCWSREPSARPSTTEVVSKLKFLLDALPQEEEEDSSHAGRRSEEESLNCKVCYDAPATMIFGCGHLCICEVCVPKLVPQQKCPFCNYEGDPFRVFRP
jgi:serine/threonine protein kinase